MKKFFLRHWHYLLIIFPLFIFIYFIWDHNFYIGGDIMVPLNPVNNIQKIFLWDNGLESFQYVGFFWFAFYYLFSLIGFPAFVTPKILLVLLLIIGFTFTYLLYKELFKNTKYGDKKLAFLSATIFTFNPIYFLMAGAGLSLYGFPVCFYFLLKFLQKGKILYAVLFSLLLNFFFFTDLPQPKLLIVFSIACFFLITVYHQITKLNFRDIFKRVFIIFLLSFLLNAWVFISLLYSLFFGAGASFVKDIGTFSGQADFKTATLPYIMRFFNYNIIRYYPKLEHFLTSPVFVIWTFAQWVILVSGIFLAAKDRKSFKIIYILVLSTFFFIFIAKGANPPLGQLYQYAIINFPLARIFRTTSSVIAGAVVLYAFLFSISTYYLSSLFSKKKVIVYIIIVLNIAIFYPLYFGYKFYNQINYTPDQKGYTIPDQYYEMGKRLDKIKEDSKVLSIPLIRGYVEKDWGYFGPDILSWITKKPLIYREDGYGLSGTNDKNVKIVLGNCGIYSLNNIKYLLFQRDSIDVGDSYENLNSGDLLMIMRNSYFDLYEIRNECFFPHFYIPQSIIYSNGDIDTLPDIVSFGDYKMRTGIYFSNINKLTDSKINELKERSDEIFVKGELKDKVSEEELGMIVKPEEISLPYVRQKPRSPFYPLVLKKEKYDKWKVRKEPEKLFEKHLFYASKRVSEIKAFGVNERVLANYKEEMTNAFGILKKLKQEGSKDFVKFLAKYEGTLWGQREKIKEIENLTDWDNTFKELEGQVGELKIKRDFSKLVYKFDIPRSGKYSLFINGLTDDPLLSERYFEEGKQELVLLFSGISKNLIDENLRIKDYSPNSIYRISFGYKAPKGGSFFVAEGKTGETAETQLSSTGDEFRNFEMFFKSSPGAQEAAVHLSISVSEEKNLKIEKIYQPEMILKSDMRDVIRDTKQIPRITFVKINPTKYKVKIEGAKDPYVLVFSESFDKRWKAYVSGQQSVTSDQYGEVVASYFDGEIKEGKHRDVFLDKDTFETWGKEPIPEERHLLVNSYANSWYIKPEDVGGKQNYELIIEFAPQKLFYIGLFISGITLVGCLIYLLYSSIVRKNRQ